jgi:protein transport protein SEC24
VKTTPVPLYHTPMSFYNFITEDDGNTGPRLMRSTCYAIGNDPSITNQTELPTVFIFEFNFKIINYII